MTSTSKKSRVLMIGLDAAEPSLIERWMADGDLPNLKEIAGQGSYGRLSSSARWLAGSPWATFYTGTGPAHHGHYHILQWCGERMAHRRAGPDWLLERPFWRDPSFGARRVIAIDVPAASRPEPINGMELLGWSTHDHLGPPSSYPAEVIDSLVKEFGRPPIPSEVYGPEPVKSLLRQRDELIRAARASADLGSALMEREAWDLFFIAFGSTHRGGHKLWDGSGARGEISAGDESALAAALKDIYLACDDAVGRLAAAAGDAVTTLVFSLHGMGPNTSRVEILPEMLRRVLTGDSAPAAKSESLLKRLRRSVPIEWRNEVKRRLPSSIQDKLSAFWRVGDLDLSTTPAFSAIADLQGYVRINLKGRERDGIVDPASYDELCQELAEGLSTFVDADSGEPVVERVVRSDQLYPEAERSDRLPDLLVLWSSSPACGHRAVRSPRYGEIAWPTPGRNPDGRSGNHRDEGFLIARGPRFTPGATIEGGDILDLAPTVSALLNLPARPEWVGRPLQCD